MSVVLITGSCGLVGSESTEFFISKGFDVIGVDNNSRLKFFGKDGDINWIRRNLVKDNPRRQGKERNVRKIESSVM